MRKFPLRLSSIAFSLFLFMLQGDPVSAQATRTWVSGVGDDANPCSRTAPCKTFAGAISKTVGGGEINCIDPGGFGALTITKSITVDCAFTEAGVLVAGTNGIVVNAGAGDIITLRGLGVWSRHLLVHSCRTIRRMRYGTGFTRLRHHDGGSPSSNTK